MKSTQTQKDVRVRLFECFFSVAAHACSPQACSMVALSVLCGSVLYFGPFAGSELALYLAASLAGSTLCRRDSDTETHREQRTETEGLTQRQRD